MKPFPTTYTEQQPELLDAIATLHNEGLPFQVDLTYGSGGFWTGVAERLEPAIRMSLDPLWKASPTNLEEEYTQVNLQADVLALPFAEQSIDSLVFDPPFIHAAGKDSVMGQRFGSYPSQVALRQMYWKALMQFQRVLKPGGLLVWKCQDIIESGKQNWTYDEISTNLRVAGISKIDMLLLIRNHTMTGHNHGRQVHARRNHSYFIVARKDRTRVEPHVSKPKAKP